jgi:hypothetical protein
MSRCRPELVGIRGEISPSALSLPVYLSDSPRTAKPPRARSLVAFFERSKEPRHDTCIARTCRDTRLSQKATPQPYTSHDAQNALQLHQSHACPQELDSSLSTHNHCATNARVTCQLLHQPNQSHLSILVNRWEKRICSNEMMFKCKGLNQVTKAIKMTSLMSSVR